MDRPLKFFDKFKDVKALFSLKAHGNMKGPEGEANKERFAEEYFREMFYPVLSDTRHGNVVCVIGEKHSVYPPKIVDFNPKCDAIVTRCKKLPIGVTGADCFVIFLYDPIEQVIGIIHASYKSIEAGVIEEAVKKMCLLGSKVKDILAVIGPGICASCYEFDTRDTGIFNKYPDSARNLQGGKSLVDLAFIIRWWLDDAGVELLNMWETRICTFENTALFSQRRDRFNPVQAGMGVICLL
ncbi:MAG: purine-nucleoside/S-methyl-5-thioadenosine phosphorylase / adenosine deaminase [Patescibacteria group bacterium]|nr:purine-nucleoside/S-methyl-5-thioadenosine phosphorylase / adenosine deaminase [Patescibacteria group bacterium]